MALSSRDRILASIAVFFAWGGLTSLLPSLRWTPWAFGAGVLAAVGGYGYLLVTTSRGREYENRHRLARPKGLAFMEKDKWGMEVDQLPERHVYTPQPLYPESFLISASLDELLEYILRDFVKTWYKSISPNPSFTNEVDKVIRVALADIRGRLLTTDLVEVVIERIVPILTTHFKDFYDAERAVRGKNLNRNVTESEELDLAIAAKYKEGKLHPAASLAYSDTKLVQQEHLRQIAKNILPMVLPEQMIASKAVSAIVEELVGCAVLFPVMQLVSDPDMWNQIIENYGRSMLQDRSTVRKLRKALDEHASPSPKSIRAAPFPRLRPGDNERTFEKFVRAARKVNNLSDARRFRSEVSSQLKKDSLKEGTDSVYLRRLEVGKKMLDQRVNQLASGAWSASGSANKSLPAPPAAGESQLETASLTDILHDSSTLSYFMEYMDRHRVMPLVQFWIVVDGFRNPLEEDPSEENEEVPANLPPWTDAERTDLAQIYEAYLSRPELAVPGTSKQAVRAFLKAGKGASQQQYYSARRAILLAQTSALEKMQKKYFGGFKKSDLFYKCLTSQEASKNAALSQTHSPFDDLVRPSISPRSATQLPPPKPKALARVSPRQAHPKLALDRATQSSADLPTLQRRGIRDLTASTRSLDDTAEHSLFGNDEGGFDSEALADSVQSLDQDLEADDEPARPDPKALQAMEKALTNIMGEAPSNDEYRTSLFGDDEDKPSAKGFLFGSTDDAPRSSQDNKNGERPNLASLGLVSTSGRIGVFTDNDLFEDEEKFLSDEHEDQDATKDSELEDEIHEAAPGDLGLAEAITILSADIDRLVAQNGVIESLTRKAELTNNTAELRILKKSKASLQREIRRKELQRQQYVIQESDNSLYGRSSIRITSIMVGKDDDGKEYAVYMVEVQRKAGEQMPAATWAITRRYSEFLDLHNKLREKYASVRHLEFPRRRMVLKLQNDFLQKRRQALEKYLQELLRLPDVCRSRDLRSFLSQSAIAPGVDNLGNLDDKQDMITRFYNSVTDGMEDILGNIPVLDQLSTAGQNLLSAATSQLSAMPPVGDDAASQAEAEAELNAFENRELEPFVKPICDIFLELFSLNRGNNWLRGRAVVVVLHQLLGGTIERKVRENVKNLLQEEAVLKYIALVKDSMWPGGVKKVGGERTAQMRLKTRTEASLCLATLVPDLAGSVVGRVNAQGAGRRLFATVNNPRLKWVSCRL